MADESTDLGPAKTLLIAVTGYLDEHYPYWQAGQPLPDGLRVELHPQAYYLVMRDEDARHWPGQVSEWHHVFRVPVRVNTDLEDGTWRLVVVTEDVKLGGKLPP